MVYIYIIYVLFHPIGILIPTGPSQISRLVIFQVSRAHTRAHLFEGSLATHQIQWIGTMGSMGIYRIFNGICKCIYYIYLCM